MKKYVKDPKPPIDVPSFECGECGFTFTRKGAAENCCKEGVCEVCGCGTGSSLTMCDSCRDQKKLDAAAEINPDDHDGPVYSEEHDKYFEDLGEFIDWAEDQEEKDLPSFLHPCEERGFPGIDIADAVYNVCQDLFEDAIDHIVGLEELDAAVKKFNDKQTMISWEPDMSKKICVKKIAAWAKEA